MKNYRIITAFSIGFLIATCVAGIVFHSPRRLVHGMTDDQSTQSATNRRVDNVAIDSPTNAPPRIQIAAIVTTFFPNSHAGVLVDKFLRGFPTDDGILPPRSTIASIYIDQIHDRDIGRQLA